MRVHVVCQHYWDTRGGAKRTNHDLNVKPHLGTQRWVEGSEKIRVMSAVGHQRLHRLFAKLAADDHAEFQVLFTDHVWNGLAEVLPAKDMIAQQKGFRERGK